VPLLGLVPVTTSPAPPIRPHSAGLDSPSFVDQVRGGLPWIEWLAPGLIVMAMCIPCIGFTYLWDDYLFLNNTLDLNLRDFLPDPADPFYRPLSRGIYFAILSAAHQSGPIIGHMINLACIALIASLLTGLGARLAGRKVGLVSGVVFAGLGCVPMLVGWACCSQDLLAMLLVLLAIHFRLSDRDGPALLCVALALLGKETALAAIPAIVAIDWLRGRDRSRLPKTALSYALLIITWASIHPAARTLLLRAFKSGATGYVGLQAPLVALKQAGKYLLTLGNLRVGRFDPTWSTGVTVLLVVVAGAAAAFLWRELTPAVGKGTSAAAQRPIIILGALLTLGPWLLTSTMLHTWSPYYASFPGMGACLLLGVWLTSVRRAAAIAFLSVFFMLGIWARASAIDTSYITEREMRVASDALKVVETRFRTVLPSVPSGSQILISVQAKGTVRVYYQIYGYRTPRLWYRDPTLLVRKPEQRLDVGTQDFLLAVAPDLDIVRIEPFTWAVSTASGRRPDYSVVEQALRTYAMGLAGTGEIDAAARLLVEMPEIDRSFEALHHRMAVMFLIAADRLDDAAKLEAGIPPATREWSLGNLPAILAQQPTERNFDSAGMRAFQIDTTDVSALRDLTRWYFLRRYWKPAGRFGERVLSLVPGDSVGLAAIAFRDSVVLDHQRNPPPPDSP